MPGEWVAQLPEDLRANDTFTSYPTLGDFAKAHLDTVGKVTELDGKVKDYDGRVIPDLNKRLENAVNIPGDSATDEERQAFYSKLGRPETPDKYELDPVTDVPVYNEQVDKAIRDILHKANLSGAQAKPVREAFVNMLRQGIAEKAKAEQTRLADEQRALDAEVNSLKDEWKGDEFKVNTELALRAFRKIAETAGIPLEEANKFVDETKTGNLSLGDRKIFLKMFAAIGKTIGNDSLSGNRGGGGGELSDEERAKKRFPNTEFKT